MQQPCWLWDWDGQIGKLGLMDRSGYERPCLMVGILNGHQRAGGP